LDTPSCMYVSIHIYICLISSMFIYICGYFLALFVVATLCVSP